MGIERTNFQIEQPEQTGSGAEPAQPAKWRLRVAAGGGVALIAVVCLVAFAAIGRAGPKPMRGPGPFAEPELFKVVPADDRIIWAYTDSEPSDFQQLCKETIELHRGTFDFRLVRRDQLFQYVSPDELPADWAALRPRYQKDAAINALLARYGGAAFDLSTVMFHSLDHWWDDRMARQNLTFKGFYYMSRAETATWFMMARREGLLRTAASAQAVESNGEPSGCLAKERDRELCYGHGMVSLALCKHQQKYCRCYFDETKGCGLTQYAGQESKFDSQAYELDNPRNSVQSPLSLSGRMREEEWEPLASTALNRESFQKFKVRYQRGGEFMPFVTIQSPGDAARMSRRELLSDKDSFFYQWLCLAKHPDTEETDC